MTATRRTKSRIRFKKFHDFEIKDQAPSLPSKKTMARSLIQAAGDVFAKGVKFRTNEEQEKCLEICRACKPYWIPEQERCAKCGCRMKLKTRLRAWSCPIGKW